MSLFSKYPLPKFPDSVIPTFKCLCEEVKAEECANLLHLVEETANNIKQSQVEWLDKGSGLHLAECCVILLNRYDEFPQTLKPLIIGAVRYFVAESDPIEDEAFASGFLDDVQVMNHVLEKLGLEELILA